MNGVYLGYSRIFGSIPENHHRTPNETHHRLRSAPRTQKARLPSTRRRPRDRWAVGRQDPWVGEVMDLLAEEVPLDGSAAERGRLKTSGRLLGRTQKRSLHLHGRGGMQTSLRMSRSKQVFLLFPVLELFAGSFSYVFINTMS